MSLENQFAGWTSPSSDTEQEKQERTERMIKEAVKAHSPFDKCSYRIYAKGSYANNTNVRADSDVDVAVEVTEVEYWEESEPGNHPPGKPYEGIWTPEKLRSELQKALEAKFPGHVDTSGKVAIQINSNTSRVDADVVPCFSYRYYMKHGSREGTKIFPTSGPAIVNYPKQQLEEGAAKNLRTGYNYKKTVRLFKRIENAMASDEYHRDLPSYFIECLVYNCPDNLFGASTWTQVVKSCLVHMWDSLQGDEPETGRWLEVNECYYLFHDYQKWTRADGRDFAYAAWNYFDFK